MRSCGRASQFVERLRDRWAGRRGSVLGADQGPGGVPGQACGQRDGRRVPQATSLDIPQCWHVPRRNGALSFGTASSASFSNRFPVPGLPGGPNGGVWTGTHSGCAQVAHWDRETVPSYPLCVTMKKAPGWSGARAEALSEDAGRTLWLTPTPDPGQPRIPRSPFTPPWVEF
jgi:hypothetical protein